MHVLYLFTLPAIFFHPHFLSSTSLDAADAVVCAQALVGPCLLAPLLWTLHTPWLNYVLFMISVTNKHCNITNDEYVNIK